MYYVEPELGDYRQGDIFQPTLHIMRSTPGFQVVRKISAKGVSSARSVHESTDPPKGGFKWDSREEVLADGQLGMCIVLTHDCEIENDDSKGHRLVGLMRPLANLSETDKEIVATGQHFGRLYLPSWPEGGLPESYVDLRRVTTLRHSALVEQERVASLTDWAREVLQRAVIRFLTEMYRSSPAS
jgi:hypothetical protein